MNTSQEQNQEEITVRQHNQYEHDYEIIKDKEDFKKRIKHKYKVAWKTEKGKLALQSYILVGEDNFDKTKFIYYTLENGKPIVEKRKGQDIAKKFKNQYDEIFKPGVLVFVGLITPNEKVLELIEESLK
jgi:hypothetical protein